MGPVRRHRQLGFSLVELLVVIAIIGLLVALLLPAVQSSRAAARRAECLSHLRQVGIALHSYHEQQGMFPPAAIWGGAPGESLGAGLYPIGLIDRVANGRVTSTEPDRVHANWLVMLLPHLDQGPLWNAFDSSMPISDSKNEVVRTTAIGVLKCPDDPQNEKPYIRDLLAGGSTNVYARGNYAFNLGPGRSCIHELDSTCEHGFHVDHPDLLSKNSVLWGGGICGFNRSFSMKDVTSGLSQFILVDEIRAGIDPLDPRGSWALGFIGASVTARHGILGNGEDANGPNNQYVSADDVAGCVAMYDKLGADAIKQSRMPCWRQGGGGTPELNDQATARSMHPGGVHVLAGDGSAHFVSDLVNPDVWFYLHNREASEPFEAPF